MNDLNRRWRPAAWSAEYIKTGKNDQVADFWTKFGFKQTGSEDRRTVYTAGVAELALQPIPFITLESS